LPHNQLTDNKVIIYRGRWATEHENYGRSDYWLQVVKMILAMHRDQPTITMILIKTYEK